MVLGRVDGRFGDRDRRRLRHLRATLTVCELAFHARSLDERSTASLERLTPREREVVDYLRLGYTNAQIACALGTAPRTIRNQLSRVYAELGVGSRTEALAVLLGH